MAQLVTNPLHTALQNAVRTVNPLVDDIEQRVDGSYLHFHSGTVWTGPAARRFDEEFAQHRSRVRTASDRILSDLRQTLARTPPEVTEDEARKIRIRYSLP
ncbi:hypothetical protein [Microbispora sp. H10836]|uniref:hypothetical protein n=1 Tax=Microbispora sp. H10836 TaxID=2729106 RepID=UPI001473C742|nr:hypothetical protein [Microbispora sp. H10836]